MSRCSIFIDDFNPINKVTFQSCRGVWLEHPRNQYFTDKNCEEIDLQVRHSLFWVKNGRGFCLRPEGEPDLTYHEAIRIAFLKSVFRTQKREEPSDPFIWKMFVN